jgi:hypothetical protein
MSPEAAEALLSAACESASNSVRTQAAFVRALLAEVPHYSPGDPRAAALRDQLADETVRLTRLLASDVPDSIRPLRLSA